MRSGAISPPADKALFATLRRLADVVLVGAGTARIEGYRPGRLPIALVTARLDLDLTSPLLADAEQRTIVLTSASAGPDRIQVADVVVCGEEVVDLVKAVDALHGRGLQHVLCEGGPTLLGWIVAAGLLDELCLTLSPLLVGGGNLARILGGPALPSPAAMQLAQLLEAEGALFARYLVSRG
jgi:riboflavin biosynthesis pyrimidine reductase